MDYVRSHFGKMNLWPVEHFFTHFRVPLVLQVPQSEEKSVQQPCRKGLDVRLLKSCAFFPHFGLPLVLQVPQSEEKKCSTGQRFIFPKWLLTKSKL